MALPGLPGYSAVPPTGFNVIGTLVHEYLDLPSLYNANLANRTWHETFAPLLWSAPVQWAVQTQKPFTSMYKFMNIASKCNEKARLRVIILDFRALVSLAHIGKYIQDFQNYEINISSDWVMRHHKLFPCLRLLMLDGLRQQEEAGLDSEDLKVYQSQGSDARPYVYLMSFRGLDIDTVTYFETSATRDVLYLDISQTLRPGHWTRAIRDVPFPNLRCLSLSGMGLTTVTFPGSFLVQGKLSLWSLNVSNNNLNDDFILVVLGASGFGRRHESLIPEARQAHTKDEMLFDYPPLYSDEDENLSQPPFNTLVPLRDDSMKGVTLHLKNSTNSWKDRMTPDDIYLRRTGITHLYISNNNMTSDAIHHLFRIEYENKRLQVLDIGSLQVKPQTRKRVDPNLPNPRLMSFKNCVTYGVINCTEHFKRFNTKGSRIESLRIHHSFVTRIPTLVKSALKDGYLLDRLKEAEEPVHQHILDMIGEWQPGFEPQFNNGLRELMLTDIPTKSYGATINALITFLKLCQEQESLLDQVRQNPAMQHSRAPPVLSGLRLLRLEFLQPMKVAGEFSFFSSSSDTSSGSDAPAATPVNPLPYSSIEKELQGFRLDEGGVKDKAKEVEEGPMDVVAELRKFRVSSFPKWGGKLVVISSL